MKGKITAFSFLLITVFTVIILTGRPFCFATERSSQEDQREKTDKVLSIFNMFGKTITRSKKTGSRYKTEVIFPEHMIPTELKAEVSSKTIEAETYRIQDPGYSKEQLLRQKIDDRQFRQPNIKIIAAVLLTLAYILGSFLLHRHHNRNLPKHT